MSVSRYCLVVALPEGSVNHYLLSAAEITIGRSSGNAIVLDWETVSSRHCRLRRVEGGYEIADLDSTNGTKVKGHPIDGKPVRLSDGDAIGLGPNVKARFVAVEEITDVEARSRPESGAVTRKLEVTPKLPEMPSINPVAAAVAKAAKAKG